MKRNLRGRLARLEKASQRLKKNGTIRYDKMVWFALVAPDRLTPAEKEALEHWVKKVEADHVEAMEREPAGVLFREQLTRLGLPQPATFAGIDVIEEVIRLTGLPDPRPGANVGPKYSTPPTTGFAV